MDAMGIDLEAELAQALAEKDRAQAQAAGAVEAIREILFRAEAAIDDLPAAAERLIREHGTFKNLLGHIRAWDNLPNHFKTEIDRAMGTVSGEGAEGGE